MNVRVAWLTVLTSLVAIGTPTEEKKKKDPRKALKLESRDFPTRGGIRLQLTCTFDPAKSDFVELKMLHLFIESDKEDRKDEDYKYEGMAMLSQNGQFYGLYQKKIIVKGELNRDGSKTVLKVYWRVHDGYCTTYKCTAMGLVNRGGTLRTNTVSKYVRVNRPYGGICKVEEVEPVGKGNSTTTTTTTTAKPKKKKGKKEKKLKKGKK